MVGDEQDGAADEVDLLVGVQEVEVHPRPPRLQADIAAHDGPPQLPRLAFVDVEDPVPVRRGARAARPALDPEEVVEESGHEPGMQPGGADADVEGKNRQAVRGTHSAHQVDAGVAAEDGMHPPRELCLVRGDPLGIEHLLQLHGEGGPQRLQDPGGARLFPGLDVGAVRLALEPDEVHRAAGADRRGEIGAVDGFVEDEHAAAPGPAEELVGREVQRIERGPLVMTHVHSNVRRRGGEIEERQRPVLVEDASHLVDGGGDPRDIRGRGERPDLPPPRPPGVRRLRAEVIQVQEAAGGEIDLHDLGKALPPRHLVGVMLVRADKNDRRTAAPRRGPGRNRRPGRWKVDAEDLLELVHGRGGPRADRHDLVLGSRVDQALDNGLRIAQALGGERPGSVVLGMRVAVQLEGTEELVLDDCHTPSRCGVIRVGEATPSEWRVQECVAPDYAPAHPVPQVRPPLPSVPHLHLPPLIRITVP